MRLLSDMLSVDPDTELAYSDFCDRGFTDGLPVIVPTLSRVQTMLGTIGKRDPQSSLGQLPPSNAEVTLEKVAINAVMAGCKPEYLPVVVAALEVILRPSFDIGAIQATTNPLTPLLIVNGPIRNLLHVNCGTGAVGPGFRANATIGRAVRLVMQNMGGARPGAVDQCTQGFAGKYTLCVGENEEKSPWEPLHVSFGYASQDSVVTVVAVNASTNIHDSSGDWQDVLKTVTSSVVSVGTANVVDPFSTPVLALNPAHARMLSGGGYDKRALQLHLFHESRIRPEQLSDRRATLRRSKGESLFTVDGMVPLTNDPSRILVVILGGVQGGHSSFLPNGHYGHAECQLIGEETIGAIRRAIGAP